MPSATERPTRCTLPQRFCQIIRATVGRRQSGGCPNLHPQNPLSAPVGPIPHKRGQGNSRIPESENELLSSLLLCARDRDLASLAGLQWSLKMATFHLLN